MRIVLFASAYAPHVGGVEELTSRLAARLREAGDAVEVWTIRHPASLPAEETIGGVLVRRFVLPLPPARPLAALRALVGARRALAELRRATAAFRPDVVNVQCFSGNGAYAPMLGVPLVVTLQGEITMDDSAIFQRSLAMRLALRRAFHAAAAVTACSAFALEQARLFGLRSGAGMVIPNGVEPHEQVEPVPVPVPRARFVLSFGRVVRMKGFDLLLEAFALVARDRPDVALLVGGDGPELPGLRARAAELGLEDRVLLPGPLTRGEVAWATENAAAFALPSRAEAFGIVVLEALRAGCPVVVTSRGGATEIVRDDVEGLVADPNDVAAFAAALARVLDDRELRARFAAAGPTRAAEFSWERITQRYRALYAGVA